MMRYLISLVLGLLAIVSSAALAGATGKSCASRHSTELNKLENLYSFRDIRVFWTNQAPLSGTDHRLPPQSKFDQNDNGIPDIIENIARQAAAARRVFSYFGFPDPLDSPRYERVRFIDINVLNMRYNGLAHDSPVHYPGAPGRGSDCTLRIDVSSQLETRLRGPSDRRVQAVFTKHWFVVGHEVFHLFQYGLTQFKRSWLDEPTAKWAEYSMRRQGLYPDRTRDYFLPTSMRDLQTNVIGAPTSTTANRFWSRLIELLDDTSTRGMLPSDLLEESYTDGEPIFRDNAWQGAGFILAIYRGLNRQDRILSSIKGWEPVAWSELDQISSEHDARLLAVIQRVVRDFEGGGAEIDAFLRIQQRE